MTTQEPIIHSISFGSEGPPSDEGLALGYVLLDGWGKMCLQGGADTYCSYTPRTMRGAGHGWCVQRFSDEHAMPHNAGYHKVGLGAWRAVILRECLEKAKDEEVIVIHCVNYKKHPHIIHFALNIRKYVKAVIKFTDLYSPPHERIANWTTNEVLELEPDPAKRHLIATAPGGICRLIIAVANEKTRNFARVLESTIKANPLILSPFRAVPYPGLPFSVKKAEQGVFNVLAYREGLFPLPWQGTWIEKMMGWRDPGDGLNHLLSLDARGELQSKATP